MNWRPECEEAFHRLKETLCIPPVLTSPDFNRPLIIQTDASERDIGVVLSQLGGDQQEHPVIFLSRKLLPREQNYATVEKECLAIVWAIQSLQVYLYDQEFTIQSEHHALQCVGRDERQESQTDKMELNFAELQVHGAAQAGQGECECRCSVRSLQARMCMTLQNLRTRDMFSSSGTLFCKQFWNFVDINDLIARGTK